MKTTVDHIQKFINDSIQLYVEANLNGLNEYGLIDYLIKLNSFNSFAILVNKAKLETILKRIA